MDRRRVQIEDWWANIVVGRSVASCSPAVLQFVARCWRYRLPSGARPVYGKLNGEGVLVHPLELGDAC